MLREVGLVIMLIIYLFAVYTICGVVGLALAFPYRMGCLEGSIVDVAALKQEQITSGSYWDTNYYFIDRESDNFYPILKADAPILSTPQTYSYTNEHLQYSGVLTFNYLYSDDGSSWWEDLFNLFQTLPVISDIINIIYDVFDWLYSIGTSIINTPSNVEIPSISNQEYEFYYSYPQVVVNPQNGEISVLATTNYIKAKIS